MMCLSYALCVQFVDLKFELISRYEFNKRCSIMIFQLALMGLFLI